jgi:hypothetical protein
MASAAATIALRSAHAAALAEGRKERKSDRQALLTQVASVVGTLTELVGERIVVANWVSS